MEGTQKFEQGFTLLELLYVVSIMGIMASTMWGFYSVYKDDASYSVAETTLRSARGSLEIGDAEVPSGTSVGYTLTGTGGGPIAASLSGVMPGAVTPEDLRIGVIYNKCLGADGVGKINQFVMAQACKSTKQIRYTKFCGGVELIQRDLPQAKGCS